MLTKLTNSNLASMTSVLSTDLRKLALVDQLARLEILSRKDSGSLLGSILLHATQILNVHFVFYNCNLNQKS